jgi:hypothetical protein
MNKIKQILNGIDKQQIHSNEGWWETSTSADFGAKKLNEIEELFKKVTSQRDELLKVLELLAISVRYRQYQGAITNLYEALDNAETTINKARAEK